MLSLDQVRSLETRVAKALSYIDKLTSENAALRERLTGYEGRIKDLEILIQDFQQDQGRIEEGILNALEKLNAFEDIHAAQGIPAAPEAHVIEAHVIEAQVEIDETEEIISEIEEEAELATPLAQTPQDGEPSASGQGSDELDIF